MSARAEQVRIMLGFIVRQCAVALGRPPTPAELAEWANNQRDARGRYRIFGRPIDVEEARIILCHPGRLVTVRPTERWTKTDPRVRLGSGTDGEGGARWSGPTPCRGRQRRGRLSGA
jgi:hypothetical protein